MTELEIKTEYQKIQKRHKWTRWVQLLLAIVLIVSSFVLIELGYSKTIPVHTFLAVFGGVCLGSVWREWHGNKETQLLGEIVEKISSE